jgi:hypothetical protein
MESITLLTPEDSIFCQGKRFGAGSQLVLAVKRIGRDGFVLALLVASGLRVNQKLR